MLDLFYPRRCPVCEKVVRKGVDPTATMPKDIGMEEYICPQCYGKLQFIKEPYCLICGMPVKDEQQEYCQHCKEKKPDFDKNRGMMDYSNTYADNMVWNLKYNNKREYADFLALEMARRFGRSILMDKCQAIIPVPVHKNKLKKRGYNQAQVVAEKLGDYFDIPVDSEALFRVKKTAPLKELGPLSRYDSLKGAFAADANITYKRVLLVDDIYTTGATLNHCSKALKAAGVQKVFCLTCCMAHGTL